MPAQYLPPLVPRIVFGVLEPLMMMGGVSIFLDPQSFVNSQAPTSPTVPLTVGGELVTLQLGNLGLFIGGVGVLIIWRSTSQTIRGYLLLQSMADLGHLAIMHSVLRGTMFDVKEWNFMTAANILGSSTLCGIRILTLLGYFGTMHQEDSKKGKRY